MPKFQRTILIAFVIYMLLCIPALAAQSVGGFVSNTPMAAGPDASIGEVWMRHGGARLQYDALMGSIQTNTNGRMRKAPAAITTLPPLYPQKRVVRKSKKSSKKVSKVQKSPMPKKANSSPKPVLPSNKTQEAPYTGTAPAAPPPAEKVNSNESAAPTSGASPSLLTPATTSVTPPTINPVPNTSASVVNNASTSTTQK